MKFQSFMLHAFVTHFHLEMVFIVFDIQSFFCFVFQLEHGKKYEIFHRNESSVRLITLLIASILLY